MGAVVSFQKEKRAREWEIEKSLLHTLSMDDLVRASEQFLVPINEKFRFRQSFLEEVCMDVAIETFLYAAKAGISEAKTKKKQADPNHLESRITELNLFISDWIQDDSVDSRRVLEGASLYVSYWWNLGFQTGLQRGRVKA
ncbi:DUF2521 family protein [Geomicrobium sp. JCM 19055]|uniref:DUF2521 family protein n=1 Tax=Geomicrobium sp. JCM 19055 TaxID=1460649 RepID=UPI00045ED583|nr:DUF2521 family protein [Geomicrobium sp. JCM 19055]GAK01102.1 hypothetical protein JCM19055_4243 [Geomicrobium sp. JCM 19055]